MDQLTQLKAQAYDLIALREEATARLQKVNSEIARLMQQQQAQEKEEEENKEG